LENLDLNSISYISFVKEPERKLEKTPIKRRTGKENFEVFEMREEAAELLPVGKYLLSS